MKNERHRDARQEAENPKAGHPGRRLNPDNPYSANWAADWFTIIEEGGCHESGTNQRQVSPA